VAGVAIGDDGSRLDLPGLCERLAELFGGVENESPPMNSFCAMVRPQMLPRCGFGMPQRSVDDSGVWSAQKVGADTSTIPESAALRAMIYRNDI